MTAKTVLLVEPDERACRAVRSALESHGYHVLSMGDVEAAVQVLPYTAADLVLTAHPLMTEDRSFATHVKRCMPRVLVVGMVERGLRDVARDALTSGCDDFLSKPVDPELLGIKLRQLIGSADDNWPLARPH